MWAWWYWRAPSGDIVGPFWSNDTDALRMRPTTMPWDSTLYRYNNGKWSAYL
jgi:hypothetical protein